MASSSSSVDSSSSSSKDDDGVLVPELNHDSDSPIAVSSTSPLRNASSSRKRSRDTKNSLSKDWSSLTVLELKKELKRRGRKGTGKKLKADLVSLLEEEDTHDREMSAGNDNDNDNDVTTTTTTKRSKTKNTKTRSIKKAPVSSTCSPKKKPRPKKAADHQRITDIDKLPKLWNSEMAQANGSYTFKIASWNVAGLRALVRKEPNELAKLCKKYDLDMLCLQEHKLQEIHLEDPKLQLKGLLDEAGYDEHWSCSTAKKGYSGTCIFVKRRGEGKAAASNKAKQTTIGAYFAAAASTKGTNATTLNNNNNNTENVHDEDNDTDNAILPVSSETLTPTAVGFSVGKEIDNEGRVVFLEFPWATIANVYVPNSGQKLERLNYRTTEWDKFFLKFMQDKQQERGLPVMWLGDLNIAYQPHDIWNDGAKHLAKQAGVTEQERASFTEQLEAGFVDVFRRLHPTAKGNYSYWSQRAGNREPNKGLRLDYFIASTEMFAEESNVIPRDCYMIMDQLGSDHAPVVVELEIKGSR